MRPVGVNSCFSFLESNWDNIEQPEVRQAQGQQGDVGEVFGEGVGCPPQSDAPTTRNLPPGDLL